MKKILTTIFILSSLLFAGDSTDNEKKIRLEKQIKIELENEKKYAKEQTFYTQENYDFKGAEVNADSLKDVNELEVDDLDMDSVYD